MSKEKKLVPKLRFEEFKNSNIWTKNPLTSLVNGIDTGKSSFNSRLVNSIEKPYPILGSRGIIGYDNTYDYEGSFILTARVGENAGNLYKHSGKVKISDNTVYLEAERLNFVYYLLANYDLKKLSFGTGQPLIKASEIRDLNLNMPIEVKEQNKVGSFFEQIDEMIQLQQSKVNKVKDLKSAYLSEMFPKEGEKYPKKRFEGFTEPWIEYSLERIGDIVGGNSWKSNEYDKEGSHLIITIANVSGDYSVDINEGNKITPNNNRYVLSEGDILISMTGNVGRVSRMPEVKAVLNQRVGKLVIDSGIDKEFIFTILQNKKFERNMIIQGQGAAQLNISRTDILNYKFKIPEYNEQKKIGQLFKNINDQISVEEEKLIKLEKLKQAYLNDMFV